MRKLLYLLTLVMLIISCTPRPATSTKENLLTPHKVELVIPQGDVHKLWKKTDRDTYISTSGYERNLLEYDRAGLVINKAGGEGQGPGEFQYIFSASASDNKIYLCDYRLNRVTIFSENLEFEDSFLIKHNYINSISQHKNNLLLMGKCPVDLYHQQNEFYAADLYYKSGNDFKFQKSVIKIDEFPKFNSPNFVGTTSYKSTNRSGFVDLLFCYSANFISYNYDTENIVKREIEFPDYISPLEINFKKYNRLGQEKWDLQNVPDYIFCYSPEFFWFDEINEKYIVQFQRPYQLYKDSDNKQRFVTVLFDAEFKYLGNWYGNDMILSCESEVGSLIIWEKTTVFYYAKDAVEPDTIELTKFEVRY